MKKIQIQRIYQKPNSKISIGDCKFEIPDEKNIANAIKEADLMLEDGVITIINEVEIVEVLGNLHRINIIREIYNTSEE